MLNLQDHPTVQPIEPDDAEEELDRERRDEDRCGRANAAHERQQRELDETVMERYR